MTSSGEEYIGWEKEEYKELSDSEQSNISYNDESDEENIKKKKTKKKKEIKEPEGKSLFTRKQAVEYSNILQEEDDFIPE